MSFGKKMALEELISLDNRLTSFCGGMTSGEVWSHKTKFSGREKQVIEF